MDDYYSLLGVDADATVDDIRGAYRTRKDALDTSSESGRADAARLNKAWNVLSDPYQRGRYDEQRAVAASNGEEPGETDLLAGANGAGSRSGRDARRQAMRDAREARMRQQATIQPPAGTRWPEPKQRVIAMIIDLVILVVVFFGSQLMLVSLEKSQHRAAYDARQQLTNHSIPDAQKQTSDDNKKLNDAKKANNPADIKTYTDKVAADKQHETELNKQLDAANNTLSGLEQSVNLGYFVLGFVYLALPSALNGQTLGKRLQRLRVLREDGSRLGMIAVTRYGSLVIVTYLLSFVAGPLAPALVLFGVTMWMRNPNRQGLHDRLAHTIVVADATD